MVSLKADFPKNMHLRDSLYYNFIKSHTKKKMERNLFSQVLQTQLGKLSFRLWLGGEGWREWMSFCTYKCLGANFLYWESTCQFPFD